MDDVSIGPLDPTAPAAAELLAALDAYQAPLYPPASVHRLPAAALAAPDAAFLGAFAGGRPVGCGGYVRRAGGGRELKRLFARPEARRLGVGRRLLAALEEHAAAAGLTALVLETGGRQPEALRLYERAGYARRGPFDGYAADPLSVFLEKRLGGEGDASSDPAGG